VCREKRKKLTDEAFVNKRPAYMVRKEGMGTEKALIGTGKTSKGTRVCTQFIGKKKK
jgi:hypothetical protein